MKAPTDGEVERLRLVLSTYQDGTGQLAAGDNGSLPSWRDLERSVALVMGGVAQESKAVFDVLVPIQGRGTHYGISCKMRDTLRYVRNHGRVTIEVSNSAGKFVDAVRSQGLANYRHDPETAGVTVVKLVENWHQAVSLGSGGTVDLARSYYLVLQWDSRTGIYQFYQFPLSVVDPYEVHWAAAGKRLLGTVLGANGEPETLVEWYADSGGQLKYYPKASQALWCSDEFSLEPLPSNGLAHLQEKVRAYFPAQWAQANTLR